MTDKAPRLVEDWLATERRTRVWFAAQVPASTESLRRWLDNITIPRRKHRARIADITGLPVAHEEAWL